MIGLEDHMIGLEDLGLGTSDTPASAPAARRQALVAEY
jgi:hypothetical protein